MFVRLSLTIKGYLLSYLLIRIRVTIRIMVRLISGWVNSRRRPPISLTLSLRNKAHTVPLISIAIADRDRDISEILRDTLYTGLVHRAGCPVRCHFFAGTRCTYPRKDDQAESAKLSGEINYGTHMHLRHNSQNSAKKTTVLRTYCKNGQLQVS